MSIKEKIREIEGPDMKENMQDQIRQWFIECRYIYDLSFFCKNTARQSFTKSSVSTSTSVPVIEHLTGVRKVIGSTHVGRIQNFFLSSLGHSLINIFLKFSLA